MYACMYVHNVCMFHVVLTSYIPTCMHSDNTCSNAYLDTCKHTLLYSCIHMHAHIRTDPPTCQQTNTHYKQKCTQSWENAPSSTTYAILLCGHSGLQLVVLLHLDFLARPLDASAPSVQRHCSSPLSTLSSLSLLAQSLYLSLWTNHRIQDKSGLWVCSQECLSHTLSLSLFLFLLTTNWDKSEHCASM